MEKIQILEQNKKFQPSRAAIDLESLQNAIYQTLNFHRTRHGVKQTCVNYQLRLQEIY